MCQWNCRELLHILWWKFMDLSLSRNFFDLDTHFLKRRVLRASKRDLEREISTTVDRDWIFFLAKFLKYKGSRCWVAIFPLSRVVLTRNGEDRTSHFKQVNHFTVKLKTLIWVFERIKALDGAMRMYSNYKVTDRASGRSFDYNPPCR